MSTTCSRSRSAGDSGAPIVVALALALFACARDDASSEQAADGAPTVDAGAPGEGGGSAEGAADDGAPGDGGASDGEGSDARPGDAASQPDAPDGRFVHAVPGGFVFPDSPTATGFVGFNSAGLSHYGTSLLQYAPLSQIADQLDGVKAIGGRVVRVFAAGNDADATTEATRLRGVLDAAAARGLYVIASLTDYYANTPYHPKGDDGAYAGDGNGYTVLADAWFAGGYETNYSPWVDAVVGALHDHPALFAWELGNEVKNPTNAAHFVDFALAVGARIRQLDPNHMIATGIISTENAALRGGGDLSTTTQAWRLYQGPFDFLVTHDYHGEMTDDDTDLAAKLSKPLIIEEMGYASSDGTRPALALANARAWHQKGARGYMQWGFLAVGVDNGDGDRSVGMDKMFHSDFAGMSATFTTLASDYR